MLSVGEVTTLHSYNLESRDLYLIGTISVKAAKSKYFWKANSFIHSLVFSLEGRAWQEPDPSHVTGMAPAHCILGKFLGVVCHCFPPRYFFIIRLIIPVVFNKLIRVECMYLSNTTLFDGRYIFSIYYIGYNYMFRRLTMAIFRLYMKYLVSSYMRLNMGCIQWGGRRRGGHEISYVSWRLGGVGTWGFCYYMYI